MLAHEPDEGLAGPLAARRPGAAGRPARTAKCWTPHGSGFPPGTEGLVADPSLSRALDDLRAVAAVRLAARYGAQPPAGPLDLGAGLVMLGNLRLYLDALEADLLDAATHLGMSWDLIAAIIGLPADDARHRLRELRDPRSALTVRVRS